MIEAIRTLIIAALVFVGFLLWQAWNEDFATPAAPSAEIATETLSTSEAVSAVPTIPDAPVANGQNVNNAVSELNGIDKSRWVTVRTDVMSVSIDTLGGGFVQLRLLDYAQGMEDKKPLVMLDVSPGYTYTADSGLVGNFGPDVPAIANVREQQIAQYSADATSYALREGQDNLEVSLKWNNAQGLQIEKKFTFYRGKYDVDVEYFINNRMEADWLGALFLQFKRNDQLPEETNLFAFPSYFGAAISSPEKRYEKIPLDELSETLGVTSGRSITDGWMAMVQHYFVSAWIPDDRQTFMYSGGIYQNDDYFMRAVGQPISVASGQQSKVTARFYSGPKITEDLKEVAPRLDLTVDYGWLWPISQALFWVMKLIYDVVANWGVAIVLVTVLIKLVFYKLSETSYRSMANMRRLQPKFTALKERYGNDKQKMSQELMALYKKEKINPLGGCLPILVQIPVFIALYWVLIESVEFRQAPFMLWIQDLSSKDPYYVLPLLMGLTMFIQQRLSPQPPDPLQAKVMMLMPILFTVIFLNFPAGLVLYWLVNNVLSIAQQWHVTRKIEKLAEKTS